jgi:hypothetical protein
MEMKTLVASDDITAVKPNGDRITIEVRVGMPYQQGVDEWGCPVSLSPLFNNIHDAVGGSSFQSICLALALVLKPSDSLSGRRRDTQPRRRNVISS